MVKLYGVVGKISSGKDVVTDYIINEYFKEEKFENKKYADKLKLILSTLLGVDRVLFEDRDFKDKHIPELDVSLITYLDKSSYRTKKFMTKLYSEEYALNVLGSDKEIVHEHVIQMTPRKLMQEVGSRMFRDVFSSDFWVQALMMDKKEDSLWVISDARYPKDEVKAIHDNKGITIGVKRKFGLRYPNYAYLEDEKKPYAIPNELKVVNKELYDTLIFESETVMDDLSFCTYVITNDGTLEELKEKVKNILKIENGCVK